MQNSRSLASRKALAFGTALALTASGAAVSFTSLPASAQPTIIGSGGSDELIPPPSPTCDDLVFVTEVSFDDAGNPIDIPRFGTIGDMVLTYDVPGFSVGPGVLALNEVITYDGHIGRKDLAPQTEEQVRFQFLLDGEIQVETPLTPDVPDGQRTGWIDVDMGTYELPNGADTLRIVHSGNTSSANSVVVSAICGELVPPPETVPPAPTTEPPSTTVPSTVSPSTSTAPIVPEPTTVPPTTAPPATTAPPETTTTPPPASTSAPVQPTPTTTTTIAQPALAVTGSESQPIAIVGGTLLATGLAMLAAAKQLRGKRS